jgi:succinate-semialdehyde dehydrogenase/glutarate-semialdehyde dehydrogenase
MSIQLQNPLLLKQQAYINGQWVDANDGSTFQVTNPSSGVVIAAVANCGAHETLDAINSADHAMKEWQAKPAKARANILRAWFELIMANQEDLAQLLTLEQGKPLAEARGEIAYGASYVEWFAEEAKRVYGDIVPAPSGDKRVLCIKQPVGAVACITPWNFPNAMLARKIAPALAAGCAVVCKPANETPLSAFALAVLAEEAGVPAGVINILCGKTLEIGGALTQSPIIRKLTFTGSTQVGKILISECAGTVKKTSMELGGNAPFIVFDDADIEQAVQGAMLSKYRNAGQTCVCANRIIVQEGIYDTFVQALSEAVAKLYVGDGRESGVTIGPLISKPAVEKVQALVQDALDKGATLVTGNNEATAADDFFYQPAILTNATDDMRVFREEIFGPVAPIFKFATEADAVRMANDTEFGLACYFYTQNMARTWRVSEALDYGIVGVNEGMVSNEMAPFGGVKESGSGREGSKYGLDDYLEIKYICMGGLN